MQTAKQAAIKAVQRLPDDASMDDIMYCIYVIQKIRRGQKAVEEGKVISHEEFKKKFEQWYKK